MVVGLISSQMAVR